MAPVPLPDVILTAVAEDAPALRCLLHPSALSHISFPLLTLLSAGSVTKFISITHGWRLPVGHTHPIVDLMLSLPARAHTIPALNSICPSKTTFPERIHLGPSGIQHTLKRPAHPQVSRSVEFMARLTVPESRPGQQGKQHPCPVQAGISLS